MPVTIFGQDQLKATFTELFDLPDKDIKAVLRLCAKEAAPEVLSHHYDKHKGEWAPNAAEYAKAKGNDEPLVRTGRMMKGIRDKKAPASIRKVTVQKLKKLNQFRISISLRKIVDGKNLYTYAQNGVAKSATVRGRFGRKKTVSIKDVKKYKKVDSINRSNRRMVCQSEAGDEQFFSSRIEDALRAYLAKKAKKASKQ